MLLNSLDVSHISKGLPGVQALLPKDTILIRVPRVIMKVVDGAIIIVMFVMIQQLGWSHDHREAII